MIGGALYVDRHPRYLTSTDYQPRLNHLSVSIKKYYKCSNLTKKIGELAIGENGEVLDRPIL